MILDHDLQFSDDQVIEGSCASTRALGLGSRGGQNLITILVTVAESFTSTDADATMTIRIESADNDEFNDSIIHATSGILPLSTLTRGAMPLCLALPQGCGDFVRLYYDVAKQANATISTGKVNASIVMDTPVLF